MPTVDPAGMTLVFQDDFTSYGDVAVGQFPAATGGRWGGYGATAQDTSGNGNYVMAKTCSIINGVLDIRVWSELVSGVQKSYGAAPWPIIPGNQPTGTINGITYSGVAVRANIYYGQIEFAFRCAVAAPGWKTAWLLWPDNGDWPKNGEIDFPEGSLNGTDTIHAFHHRQDATTGSDQDSRNSGVIYADSAHTWHTGKIVWKPNFLEFWLDGVRLGATITSRVDAQPMHWVFQTETQLSGGPPPIGSDGHMQIDWIRMHQLDGIYAPAPTPTGATVTVAGVLALPTPDGKANTRTGVTSVHSQTRTTTTKNIIGAASTVQNQHLVGFGSNVDPQPTAGGAYNWSFMDATFGFPTKTSGYFSTAQELCLTACGCPPHMRSPKSGQPWDPMGTKSGTQLTSLSDYTPPNSSWYGEFAQLIADFMVRYPHVKYIHVWNELKGFYFVTQASGSNLVPAGSGLPAGASGGNRWWYEGYTAMFNEIWRRVKAVRPDAFIVGPYNVLNSFSWDSKADWSDDPFPDNYQGPWGYGDKKVLAVHRYFLANCRGLDALCMDIRNMTKDNGVTGYYNPASIPATPAPTNPWMSNPDKGAFGRYWKEGQEDGAWNNGQKLADWIAWVRALGNSSPIYQRPVCDARTIPTWAAEWYAYGSRTQFKMPNPATGNYYNEATSSHAEEACAFAWQWLYALEAGLYTAMFWKPEGSVQGNVTDAGDSNPLAIYYQNGSALSLQPTELAPVMNNIVARFPVGTQMYKVTTTSKYLRGCASVDWLMIANRKPSPLTTSIVDPNNPTQTVTLAGYEVRFIAR